MEEQSKQVTRRERDGGFEELIAGGAKTRLLESFLDSKLAPLLASKGPLSAQAVAEKLSLHHLRARKWLHLLNLIGLVDEIPEDRAGMSKEVYALSPFARALFGEDGKGGEYWIDRVQYWRNVAVLDFNAVLKGLSLPAAVKWPPQTLEAAQHLEWWMSVTAAGAIQAIEKAVNLSTVTKMLDAAGGDATMACAFSKAHPNLKTTIFNLPNSAFLARRRIAQEDLTDKITVLEMDFLSEQPFPQGFELVLWSRVFSDWPSDVVLELLHKTYQSLTPGGRVVICEPLLDQNRDLVINWEFRYLFYDDFGVAVYKSRAQYEKLLQEAGFTPSNFYDVDEESFYSVIVATRT